MTEHHTSLSPPAYMEAVTKNLFGRAFPETKWLPEMRAVIEESRFIETHRDDSKCDTITYREAGKEKCEKVMSDEKSIWKAADKEIEYS